MSERLRKLGRGQAVRWQAPAVDTHPANTQSTTDQLELARQRAHDQGFAQGRAEGLASGRAEIESLRQQMNAIVDALDQPLQAVDEAVIQRLTELSFSIARRLVRRELRTNRSEVIAVVREALSVLPMGLSDIRLHLHPDDARLVSETLVPAEGQSAWQIVEDPVITRGGCRVSSTSSQLDATVETRLARVISGVLGGDRDEDRSEAAQ